MKSTEFIREAAPGQQMTDAEYAAQQAQGQANLNTLKGVGQKIAGALGSGRAAPAATPAVPTPLSDREGNQIASGTPGMNWNAQPAPAPSFRTPGAAQAGQGGTAPVAAPAPSFATPGAAQAGQGGTNYTTGAEQDRPHRTDAGGDETTRNDYPFTPPAIRRPGQQTSGPRPVARPKPVQAATPAVTTPDYDYTDPMGTDDASSIMAASRAGQAARAAVAPASAPARSVAVKPGDTLGKIAAAAGTTVAAIMAANPTIRDANKIAAGQSIKLPGAPAQAATPAARAPLKPGLGSSPMRTAQPAQAATPAPKAPGQFTLPAADAAQNAAATAKARADYAAAGPAEKAQIEKITGMQPTVKPGLGSSPMRESSFDHSVNSMRRLSNMLKG